MGFPKEFPRSVGMVESRLLGFPCSVISVACFGNAYKITVTAKTRFREQESHIIKRRPLLE